MPYSSIDSHIADQSCGDESFASIAADDRLRAGATYWASLRRGRRAPRRRDIDPTEVPSSLLPWIVLADREAEDFRIRLTGTGQYGLMGRDLTGRTLSTLTENADYNAYIGGLYQRVESEIRPIYSATDFRSDGSNRRIGRVMTPLSDDGEAVSHILTFQVELRVREPQNTDSPFFTQSEALSYIAVSETPLYL